MLDATGTEDTPGEKGGTSVESETAKAEAFLAKEREANKLREKQAQIAIEDALIRQYQIETGRTLRDREKDLASARQWQADLDAEKEAKAREFIRQQAKFKQGNAQKANATPLSKPPRIWNWSPKEIVNFVKGLVVRK